MAENANNRDTEHFTLGLIVAAIVFFLLRREFDKLANAASSGGRGNGAGDVKSSCGCNTGNELPDNPGISIGNESFNYAGFAPSSVKPQPTHANF